MAYKHFIWITALFCAVHVIADDTTARTRSKPHAEGFSYGLALGVSREPYKGYDYRIIPLPVLGYKGEKLTIMAPFIHYQLLDTRSFKIELGTGPRFQDFDESDSTIFAGMDARKFSLDATLGVTYQYEKWQLKMQSLVDMLGRSSGFEGRLLLSRKWYFGPIFVTPNVGLSYLSDKHVDYYYGVRRHESSLALNRPYYQGSSALNTTLGLNIATPIGGGMTILSLKSTWYDDAIVESPLIDQNRSVGLFLSHSRFF